MADEVGIHVPGEEDPVSLSPQIVETARIEKAKKKGWKPLEDYDGDPADWIDAKEFLGREPLFEANRDLKRQLKQQHDKYEGDFKTLSSQFTQMNEAAYKRALNELNQQRDMAIVDKDLAAVKQLDSQIDETKKAHVSNIQQTAQTQQNPSETQYMKDWRSKNEWFDSDPTLQDEAVSIGVGYMMKNQGTSQEKMLEYVEDRIKKIYPEKFPSKKRTSVEKDEGGKEAANTVDKTTRNLGISSSRSKTMNVSDLSEMEMNVMRTFIKRGVLKDLAAKNKRTEQEEYLAQLAERR